MNMQEYSYEDEFPQSRGWLYGVAMASLLFVALVAICALPALWALPILLVGNWQAGIDAPAWYTPTLGAWMLIVVAGVPLIIAVVLALRQAIRAVVALARNLGC